MTQARLERIKNTLHHRQNDVTILLEQVHKPHNLAAIVRTCDAVGVPEIHAIETNKQELKGFRSVSMGSENWVNLQIHNDKEKIISDFKKQGKQVLAAHLSDKAISFREIDFTKPTAIVMGTEKWGISAEMAEIVDQHIIVPMHGMVESLNVSVASALILFEMERQRTDKGMYNHTTIDSHQLFEWIQPKMAKICQDNNWDYPDLDDDGDIINPSKWYHKMLISTSME